MPGLLINFDYLIDSRWTRKYTSNSLIPCPRETYCYFPFILKICFSYFFKTDLCNAFLGKQVYDMLLCGLHCFLYVHVFLPNLIDWPVCILQCRVFFRQSG